MGEGKSQLFLVLLSHIVGCPITLPKGKELVSQVERFVAYA